jgi:isovaleryl-CoA dehydrogenase
MTINALSPALREIIRMAQDVALTQVAPFAEAVDREARWPAEAMSVLGAAGLLGLHVPQRLGGLGLGYEALAHVTEVIGRHCSSTALVFGMHCVATRVIAAKATSFQEEQYLVPIAEGRHVTSLALSEPGTGVHFYLPRTTFERQGDAFVLNGQKSFVTSGGRADSYVVSVVAAGAESDPGTFSCLILDDNLPGINWGTAWEGLGMRGNSSRSVTLDGAEVPATRLLGREGDEIWYIFEVVAPYFITAMAGTYLGIAQAALELTTSHLRKRTYEHTGAGLGAEPTIVFQLGEMWTAVERARQLIYHAARLADAGRPEARATLFACKAEVANTVVWVTNQAMSLTGGIAYGANSRLAGLLRDARASHIMAPTTNMVNIWLGRTLLDLPLL